MQTIANILAVGIVACILVPILGICVLIILEAMRKK